VSLDEYRARREFISTQTVSSGRTPPLTSLGLPFPYIPTWPKPVLMQRILDAARKDGA
jgi:hypothetical protein